MEHIYFSPRFALILSTQFAYLSMALYLIVRKPRAKASIWLGVNLLSTVVALAGWSVVSVIPASQMPVWLGTSSDLFAIVGQSTQILALLQFAYHYRENATLQESRIVLYISLLFLSFFVYGFFLSDSRMLLNIASNLFLLGGSLWAVIVLVRKMVSFSRQANGSASYRQAWMHFRDPQGHDASMCRLFSGFVFTLFLLSTLQLLVWFIPNSLGIPYEIIPLLSLALIFGMFVAFTNDKSHQTSMLIKLVGSVLIAFMLGISVLVIVLFNDAEMEKKADLKQLENVTFRFELDPDDPQKYTQKRVVFSWRSEFDEELEMEDETDLKIQLGFVFPFYGRDWHDAHLNANGLISFGRRIGSRLLPQYEPTQMYDGEMPRIALFYSDLDPARGRVLFRSGSESATITWEQVPYFQAAEGTGGDIQMTLFTNGTIDFSYRKLPERSNKSLSEISSLIGIHPGKKPGEIVNITHDADIVAQSAVNGPIIEDRYLLFAKAAHPVSVRLIWLVLGSFVLLLIGFPLLLRGIILKPLHRLVNGVHKVKEGDFEVQIQQETGDEIGMLTAHFNHMAISIRDANRQLYEHAETLESKVEARTKELRESLESLQRAQQQLVQQEKMASLGQLTAGIAHEIKNPLNFVNNFSELSAELIEEIREDTAKYEDQIPTAFKDDLNELLEDLQTHQQKINKHGRRADGIVQSMLAHSRNAPGEVRQVDLNKFADEFIGLAYHGIRSTNSEINVHIERNYDDTIGKVSLMPQGAGQVLVNLLNNALFAVLERAKMMNEEYQPTVCVSTACEDHWIILSISDNGIGIPARLQERIFEPFFTTKPTGSGTGLGLSLSYEIITEAHGGKLEVESIEGEGSTFIISLPRHA